jgi:hypothetical protein
MVMVETFTPLYHEIFAKVNNAKDKPKKVAVLRKYDTPNLRNFLMCAFNQPFYYLIGINLFITLSVFVLV